MIEAHAWNEKLELGHQAMDHDHHLQIALIAAFTEAVEGRRPWAARRLLGQLDTYSSSHFLSEEMLMEAGGFSFLTAHAEEHRGLTRQIEDLQAAFEEEQAELSLSLALELGAGLAAHIASADRALAAHLTGVRPPDSGRPDDGAP